MTRKIFYEDQYQKECDTNIKQVIENGNKILLILEDSLFYPEGGGQPCDHGFIDDAEIIRVFEKDGTIYNEVSKAPNSSFVHCKLDFERRYDLMQQHTGEHLLSAAFLKKFNGVNKGFHLGDEYTTIDIDLPEISEDMERIAELEANNYIYKNTNISNFFVKRDEAQAMPLRTQLKVNDELIRIVNMEGSDMCACCGTHLKTTGEVGIVKIIKIEKHKGMNRVYFKCGKRALADYGNKHSIISSLVRISATEENKLEEKYLSQNEKIAELTKKLQQIKKKTAQSEGLDLISRFKDEIIYKEYEDRDFDEVQMISEEVIKKNIIFIGVSENDRKIIANHNGYSNMNLGEIFRLNIKDFGGKGGGDAKRAQGTFQNTADLKEFSDLLITKVTGQ